MADQGDLENIIASMRSQAANPPVDDTADLSPEHENGEGFSLFDYLSDLVTGKSAREKAKLQGVDPSGAPIGVRFKEGMQPTAVQKVAALNNALHDEFGQDVPMRYDQNLGQVIFLHPKTNQWTTVEAPGITLGNLASTSGEWPSLIGEGAALALASRKNPAALRGLPALGRGILRIGAAATGAGLGGAARVPLADLTAPTGDLPPGEEKKSALEEGVDAAKTSAVANTVAQPLMAGAKTLNRALGGRSLPPDAVRVGLQVPAAGAPAVDVLNETIAGTGKRMPLSTGSLTRDAETLAFEAQLAGKPGPGRDTIARMEAEQADATDAYVKLLNEKFDQPDMTKTGAGKEVVRAAESKFSKPESVMANRVNSANRDALNAIAPIEDIAKDTPLTVAPSIRDAATNEIKSFWKWADDAYGELNRMAVGAHGAPIEVQPGHLSNIAKDQLDKFRQDIAPILREENKTLVDQIVSKIDSGQPLTFDQVSRFISQIKAAERSAREGTALAGVDAKALGDLKKAAVADRNQALFDYGRSDIIQYLNETEQRYRQWKTKINDSVVGQMFDRNTTVPKVKDEKLFDAVFHPKGITDAKAFNEVLQQPENWDARSKFVGAIYSKYLEKAGADGLVSAADHAKFLKNYGEVLDIYLKPEERAALDTAGGAAKALFDIQTRQEAFRKALSKATGSNFRTADPSSVFPELWRNPGKLEAAKDFLERDFPDAWKALQAAGAKQIAAEIYGPNSMLFRRRTVSADQLDRLLDPVKGKAEQIEKMFGEDYLSGLEILRDASRQAQLRGTLGGGGRVESTWRTAGADEVVANLIKMKAGPLSRVSRMMTNYLNFSDSVKQKNFAELVLNPDALAEAARSYQQSRSGVLASYLAPSEAARHAVEGFREPQDADMSALTFLKDRVSKNPDLLGRLKAIVEKDRGPSLP